MATHERQRRVGGRGLATWVAAGLLCACTASADVIVLRDGVRVSTSGQWEVRGPIVVFHDERGHLRSLQLEQVDLEASRRETERARQAARQRRQRAPEADEPAATRRPVLVLTDDDVEHVSPDDPAREGGGDDDSAEEEDEATAVVVTEWSQQADADTGGVTLRGSVRNTSGDTVGSLRVLIELYDAEGAQLASTTAAVQPPALTPRASGRFQIRVPGVPDFDDARFHVDSVALATQEPRPAAVPGRANESRPNAEEPDTP